MRISIYPLSTFLSIHPSMCIYIHVVLHTYDEAECVGLKSPVTRACGSHPEVNPRIEGYLLGDMRADQPF